MTGTEVNIYLFFAAHILLFVVEGLYLISVLTPKIKKFQAFLGYFLLNFIITLIGFVFGSIKAYIAVPYYLLRTAYMILINKDKMSKRIMCIIIMYALFMFTEMLSLSFVGIMKIESPDLLYITQFGLMQIMYIIILAMFAYFIKTLDKYNIGKKSLLFIMLPASQFLLLNSTVIYVNVNGYIENVLLNLHLNYTIGFAIYFIATMVFSLVIDIAVFRGFVDNLKLHDTELKLKALEYQNNANLRYYTDLQENTKSMKKIKHDFLNILQIMYGLNENTTGNEEVDALYNELVERIKSIRFEDYCDNNLVNAILASKIGECRGDDVKLEIKAAVGENISLNDFDLCRVLVNMLDNAIEACRKIENHAERKITFEMFKKEDYLYIITSNPVPDKEISDFSVTSKPNKKEHGIGIEILNEIAKINNGEYIINSSEGMVRAMLTVSVK